ncbi:hypothetical protein EV121DRAFT_292894 [Schizophyllum commune]
MEFQNSQGDHAALRLERIQDLWFSDGSIVIRVGERVCRVHQSILAVNSPVLAGMFSIPQPENAEMFDGLPMMSFPDPPEEVLHWLKSMLLPGYFEVYPSRIHQDRLLATLRLSHKYGVQRLRQRALYHLSIAFPSVFGFAAEDKLLLDKDHKRSTTIDGDFDVAFFCKVHALAVEIGAHWLQPSVIYTIHAATYFDDDARARLPALLASQDMLQLLNVTRASLAEFQPVRLTQVLSEQADWLDQCTVGGTKCRDGVKAILEKGLHHLIAQPLSFPKVKANAFMADRPFPWTLPIPVEVMIDRVACQACKDAFFVHYYIDACPTFLRVFKDTPSEIQEEQRAVDVGMKRINGAD